MEYYFSFNYCSDMEDINASNNKLVQNKENNILIYFDFWYSYQQDLAIKDTTIISIDKSHMKIYIYKTHFVLWIKEQGMDVTWAEDMHKKMMMWQKKKGSC